MSQGSAKARAAARRAKAKAIVAGGAVRLAAEKQKNKESGACVVSPPQSACSRSRSPRAARVLAHDRRAADLAGHARDGRDVAHELVVRALSVNNGHARVAHSPDAGGVVGRRRGDGVLDDDDAEASSLQAQGRLRDAHVRLQADQYPRIDAARLGDRVDGGPDVRLPVEIPDQLVPDARARGQQRT